MEIFLTWVRTDLSVDPMVLDSFFNFNLFIYYLVLTHHWDHDHHFWKSWVKRSLFDRRDQNLNQSALHHGSAEVTWRGKAGDWLPAGRCRPQTSHNGLWWTDSRTIGRRCRSWSTWPSGPCSRSGKSGGQECQVFRSIRESEARYRPWSRRGTWSKCGCCRNWWRPICRRWLASESWPVYSNETVPSSWPLGAARRPSRSSAGPARTKCSWRRWRLPGRAEWSWPLLVENPISYDLLKSSNFNRTFSWIRSIRPRPP